MLLIVSSTYQHTLLCDADVYATMRLRECVAALSHSQRSGSTPHGSCAATELLPPADACLCPYHSTRFVPIGCPVQGLSPARQPGHKPCPRRGKDCPHAHPALVALVCPSRSSSRLDGRLDQAA